MSTHEVKVIRIENIGPHEKADRLELVTVWGYTCVVRKGQFKVGDLAAFIEPDYTVPLDRPEFAFLSKPGSTRTTHRIAVSRLRGVYSSGLLVGAPEGSKEGDNVIKLLGIERYEPPESNMTKGCAAEHGPEVVCPKYDLENLKKYYSLLIPGEECIITAKLHGTSGRFVYHNDRMYCGSRTTWRMKPGTIVPGSVFKNPWYKTLFAKLTGYKLARPDSDGQIVQKNAWWEALAQNPWIEEFCKANPGVVVYGEVVGPTIQGENYHYGFQKNQVGFFVFDIIENGKWIVNDNFVNYGFFQDKFSCLQFVPTLYHGPYDVEVVKKLAEEVETFNNANHIREGVVVKVIDERYDPTIGRVALKYVSDTYLERG